MATIYKEKRNGKYTGRYILQWRENGKRERKPVGKDKAEAEKALKRKEAELTLAEDRSNDKPKPEVAPREVFDFLERWLPDHKSPRTAQRYLEALANFRAFCSFKHFPSFGDIRPRHIDDYMSWRKAAGIASGTIDSERTMLSHLWKIAIDYEFAVENVVKKTRGPHVERKDIRALTREEISALLDASDPYYRALWTTFILTGMRRGEVLKLERRDIDFERKVITVRPSNDKKRRGRSIPIHPKLLDVLKGLPRRSEKYVFASVEGGQIKHLWRALQRCCHRAGIKPVSVHELRDTAATYLIRGDANVFVVQQILGHKDLKSTMKYVHLDGKDLQGAILALDVI